jgi:hypothetical protein
MKGEAPVVKVEISVPEVMQVFKELQEQPGKILEMVRVNMPKAVGEYLSEMMKPELTRYLGRQPYERIEESNHRNGSYPRSFALKGIGEVAVKVPICHELGQALDDYVQSADLKPSAKLFAGHENTYRYQVRECAKKAGLDNWRKIHPHSFRHGRVYYLAQRNTHPYVLSKLMGHSSLGITLAYYQPTEADLRDAIENKGSP